MIVNTIRRILRFSLKNCRLRINIIDYFLNITSCRIILSYNYFPGNIFINKIKILGKTGGTFNIQYLTCY